MKTAINPDHMIQDTLDYTLFSWSKQAGLNPVSVKRAAGVYLWDYSGKRILDFSSQLVNVNIGHGNPKVAAAVAKQMSEVSYVYPGMVTEIRAKVGKMLSEIAPGNLNKTFFTLGGADAIDNAIKLARYVTRRHKIICHYRSYHGSTLGAISASGDPRRHPVDSQQVPNIIHVENPYFYRCPWNTATREECGEMAARNLEQVIHYESPDTIAAILVEGESGTSGCIKYPPNYLNRLREICNRYGILLIVDEVMSGFGRTGKMFAVDHAGIVPDIMCIAKGLTSGYVPLGAMMVTDDIAAMFDEQALPLGLTYSAHPVSLAAAAAVLKIYEDENLVENAASMGRYVEECIAKLAMKHESIGDFRNTGLLGAIELVKNRATKEPLTRWNAKPSGMEATNRIAAMIREAGMFTFVRWSWIFIAPPLCITKEQIDEGMEIIDKACAIADEYGNWS